MLARNQFPAGTSLHLAGLELHASVTLCKFTVLRTLVGPVCVQILHGGLRDPLAVPDGPLDEMAVGECRGLHLHGCDDAGLLHFAILVPLLHGLRDVGHVALHLLAVLVAVAGIRVVGVLDAVGRDGLLVAELHLPVLADKVLLAEHAVKKTIQG